MYPVKAKTGIRVAIAVNLISIIKSIYHYQKGGIFKKLSKWHVISAFLFKLAKRSIKRVIKSHKNQLSMKNRTEICMDIRQYKGTT